MLENGEVEAVIFNAELIKLKISKYMGALIGLLGLTNLARRNRTLSYTQNSVRFSLNFIRTCG